MSPEGTVFIYLFIYSFIFEEVIGLYRIVGMGQNGAKPQTFSDTNLAVQRNSIAISDDSLGNCCEVLIILNEHLSLARLSHLFLIYNAKLWNDLRSRQTVLVG